MTIEDLEKLRNPSEPKTAPVSAIQAAVKHMQSAIEWASAERQAVRTDRRNSDEYRRESLDRIASQEQQAVHEGLTTLWGDPDTPGGTLEGGLVWREIDQAEMDLRVAKEQAALEDDADRLQRDQDNARRTLAVVAAEEKLGRVFGAASHALEASQKAAAILEKSYGDYFQKILGRINARTAV